LGFGRSSYLRPRQTFPFAYRPRIHSTNAGNALIVDNRLCRTSAVGGTVPLDVSAGTAQLVPYGTGIHNATTPVTVNVGKLTLPTVYAGVAPGFAGEDQVNVVLPATLAGSGLVQLSVSVAGVTSNLVTIYIQ
jgi:hypothetical protein